jgi:hypothetical protein
LFALLRTSPDGREHVVCVHNVSHKTQIFQVNLAELGIAHNGILEDSITDARYPISNDGRCKLALEEYQVLWLRV